MHLRARDSAVLSLLFIIIKQHELLLSYSQACSLDPLDVRIRRFLQRYRCHVLGMLVFKAQMAVESWAVWWIACRKRWTAQRGMQNIHNGKSEYDHAADGH